jgi:hypothetical protein
MVDENLMHCWTRFSVDEAKKLTAQIKLSSDEAFALLHGCMAAAPAAHLETRLLGVVQCMADTPVREYLDVDFVTLAISKRMFGLFKTLHDLAVREIGIELALCDETQARKAINAAFALRLVDTAAILLTVITVMETLLSNARQDIAAHFIGLIFTLFDFTVLHPNSGFLRELKTLLSPHQPLAQRLYDSQKELQRNPGTDSHTLLSYKHVDMTAAAGSKWLRALVLNEHDLVEEERDFHLSVEDALIARLSHFARLKKRSTKERVLCAVVDGQTLFEFVVHVADQSTVSMLLLDTVVYCVTQEFPDLLSAASYDSGFAKLRERGLYCAYVSSRYSLTLVARAHALIGRTAAVDVQKTLQGLRRLVADGLVPSTITLFLCVDETLRGRDVVAWRTLLKQCLAEFPVPNDVVYDRVFVK